MSLIPASEKAQEILKEMKPLGEWLMEARPMTRALGRTQYAKKHGYDALRALDAEYAVKYDKYNKLSTKYRRQRMADQKKAQV